MEEPLTIHKMASGNEKFVSTTLLIARPTGTFQWIALVPDAWMPVGAALVAGSGLYLLRLEYRPSAVGRGGTERETRRGPSGIGESESPK